LLIVLDGGLDTPKARGGGFDAAFARLLWLLVADVANADVVTDADLLQKPVIRFERNTLVLHVSELWPSCLHLVVVVEVFVNVCQKVCVNLVLLRVDSQLATTYDFAV